MLSELMLLNQSRNAGKLLHLRHCDPYVQKAACRLFLFLSLFLGGVVPTDAQSLFDTGDGKGSLPLPSGGHLDLNFAEKTANLTLTRSTLENLTNQKIKAEKLTLNSDPISIAPQGNFRRMSISLRGKPDGNSTNLFSSGRPGVGAGLTFGYGISGLASALPSPEEDEITGSLLANLDDPTVPAAGQTRNILSLSQLQQNDLKAKQDLAHERQELQSAEEALASASNPLQEEEAKERRNAAKDALQPDQVLKIFVDENGTQTNVLHIRQDALNLLTMQQQLRDKHHLGDNPRLDRAIKSLIDGDTLTADRVAALASPYNASASQNVDFDHLDFRLALDYDRFNLADVDTSGHATQTGAKSSTSLDAFIAYSREIGNRPSFSPKGEKQNGSPLIFGIAAGYGRSSNKSDLEPIDGSEAFRRSDFKEVTSFKVNTDFAFSPGRLNNRVWFNLFTRNTLPNSAPKSRYGVGAFLTEPGNSYKTIGGMAVSTGSHEGLRVDLILGFNFGS